jgi:hypothetical protein
MISSKRSKVSGAGCKSDIRMVPSSTFTNCLKLLTIEKVVELQKNTNLEALQQAHVSSNCRSDHNNKNQNCSLLVQYRTMELSIYVNQNFNSVFQTLHIWVFLAMDNCNCNCCRKAIVLYMNLAKSTTDP